MRTRGAGARALTHGAGREVGPGRLRLDVEPAAVRHQQPCGHTARGPGAPPPPPVQPQAASGPRPPASCSLGARGAAPARSSPPTPAPARPRPDTPEDAHRGVARPSTWHQDVPEAQQGEGPVTQGQRRGVQSGHLQDHGELGGQGGGRLQDPPQPPSLLSAVPRARYAPSRGWPSPRARWPPPP